MKSVRKGLFVWFITSLFVGCQPAEKPADKAADKPADGNATSQASPGGDAASETQTLPVAVVLCGKCGEEKGSDKCCVEAPTCSKCGKHEGSKLCCKELPADAAGKDICLGCGHIAEGEHKCDPAAEKCDKCGLAKGSPACCKL